MNKLVIRTLGGLLLSIFITSGAIAQEAKKETKKDNHVKILIQKEDKTVLDTTFSFEGNLDKDFVNNLVKEYSGDNVKVNVFSSKEEGCEHDEDVEVKVEGEMIYVTTTGEEGEYVINIKEIIGDDFHKKHNVKVIKKTDGHVWIDEDEHEHEVNVTLDVIKAGVGEKVMVFSTDGKDIHKEHGVNIVKEGDANFWIGDKKSNVVVDLKGLEAKGDMIFIEGDMANFTKKGDYAFFGKAPKKAKRIIALDQIEGNLYKLELNTDDMDPIVVEVFNSTGDRLYKKKVKNYYGRFLQEIELEDNESAFFTVKVTQGEKEIIGEFEF